MPPAEQSLIDRLMGRTDPVRADGEETRPGLALITGCPRSGTTSVLNWLGAQSGVVGSDESRLLVAAHQYLNAVDRFTSLNTERASLVASLRSMMEQHFTRRVSRRTRWIVEKEPLERIAFPDGRYDVFLRHVRELLPEVRLVYMLREPVATVSSMRARRWGYTLTSGETREISLDEAIDTWLAGAELAGSLSSVPNTYLCRYEALVKAPAQESAAIAEFLRLASLTPFVPKPARPVLLTDAEVSRVRERTQEIWMPGNS